MSTMKWVLKNRNKQVKTKVEINEHDEEGGGTGTPETKLVKQTCSAWFFFSAQLTLS